MCGALLLGQALVAVVIAVMYAGGTALGNCRVGRPPAFLCDTRAAHLLVRSLT